MDAVARSNYGRLSGEGPLKRLPPKIEAPVRQADNGSFGRELPDSRAISVHRGAEGALSRNDR